MFRFRVVLFVAACSFLCAASFGQVQTPRKPAITTQVNNNVTMVLEGSKHPLAQARFDVGAVDPGVKMNRVILSLSPTKEAQADLQSFLDRQQDKSSPDFHHWLTPEEFGAKYGPAPEDLQTIKTWLEHQGIQVTSVAKSGLWMELSGTSAQMETAFRTQMRQYKANGEMHIANATELSIPAALGPVVNGVVSLHNFFKKPLLGRMVKARANADGTYSPITPDATLPGGTHTLTPGDYAKIYDISSLYGSGLDGTGIKIGLVARSDVNSSDASEFRNVFDVVGGGTISNVLTLSPDPGFDPTSNDSVEATLDAEWAGGVAKGANVQMIVSSSTVTTDGVDLSSAFAVEQNQVDVLSASFGQCERTLGSAENAFFNSLWEQAAAQGISVFVSSGDNGAAGCDPAESDTVAVGGLAVSGLASTPFNTAVGGTEFNEGTNSATFWNPPSNPFAPVSVNGYIPEMVWNETCNPNTLNSPCAGQGFFLDAGSGGQSTIYPKPAWQTGFPSTTDTSRDIPDVSLSAAGHDGYLVCFNNSCQSGLVNVIGGTSASSPSFAGIMAIVDQALGGRQGLANYTLYRLARTASDSCGSSSRTIPTTPAPSGCIFNDVTVGNNSVPGQAGFNATTGYDLATGLGSVNAANLVSAWSTLGAGLSTTTVLAINNGTAVNVPHGTAIPVNVTVSDTSGPAPTGAVALISSTAGPFGALTLSSEASGSSTAASNVSNLPGGTYTLTAHYPGDSATASSNSNAVTLTITREGSSTSLTSFAVNGQGFLVPSTTFAYGDLLELNSRTTGNSGAGVATGNISFNDSGNLISTAPINLKGQADLFIGPTGSPTPLTPGPHTLTAVYSGDTSFTAGTQGSLLLTIGKGNAGISIDSGNLIAGIPGSVSAAIIPAGPIAPSGTIQFLDSGVPLGSPVIITPGFGDAGVTATFPNDGPHSITADYSGDATYNAQVTAPTTVNVVAPFIMNGAASQSLAVTVQAGQSALYNLLIGDLSSGSTTNPNNFSGTVTFSCSGLPAGAACSFTPASVALTPTQSVPFTLSVSTSATASLHQFPFRGLPVVFAGVLALAMSLKGKRKYAWQATLVMVFALGISSCGGGGSTPAPTPTPRPPTTSAIIVTGTSGGHTSSISLSLTITH